MENELQTLNETRIQTLRGPIDLDELERRFMAYYETTSEDTIRAYSSGIRRFLEWLRASGITAPTRDDVRAYRDGLAGRGLKASTINAALAAIRIFFKWLADEGLYKDIADRVKRIRIDRSDSADAHRRTYLRRDELASVLETATGENLGDLRDAALLRLMATSGLRCIEVSRADVGDIRIEGEKTFLRVWGKGRSGKDASVELCKGTADAITRYIQERGDADASSPLFASLPSNFHRNDGGRMTRETVSKVVKMRLRMAGIDDERHTAHSLRHTAGTMAYRLTRSIETTRRYMRHHNIQTTMGYVHDVEREEDKTAQMVGSALLD